ncbi:heterochromatin protein 1-binding protein 3 [Petromyzon marinus]|uniref:heterochromatin protein 1-binding protein 3 n=1 Tax=Petromyzon marinus TaxID=7757 RepID=UPI003F6ECCC0
MVGGGWLFWRDPDPIDNPYDPDPHSCKDPDPRSAPDSVMPSLKKRQKQGQSKAKADREATVPPSDGTEPLVSMDPKAADAAPDADTDGAANTTSTANDEVETVDKEAVPEGEEAGSAAKGAVSGAKGVQAAGAGKDDGKQKRRIIPSWASLTSSQNALVQRGTCRVASNRPKMAAILTEALQACAQRGGASVVAIRKYIVAEYPGLGLQRRGYLLKQALSRERERGRIRQLTGKGASGRIELSKPSARANGKTGPQAVVPPTKLEDALPLAFTRVCVPKEASVAFIRKYLLQHYQHLPVGDRPTMLKQALQRCVGKGQLEQITGKGASGTFQLSPRSPFPRQPLERAISTAIVAMNEPKTASATALRKHFAADGVKAHVLKRVLHKCVRNGWIDQISGHGFSGTYRLAFPYYPSPLILFPEDKDMLEGRAGRDTDDDMEDANEDEEEEEHDEEDDDDEDEESESDYSEPKHTRARKRPRSVLAKKTPRRSSASSGRAAHGRKRSSAARARAPAKRGARASRSAAAPPAAVATPAKQVASRGRAAPAGRQKRGGRASRGAGAAAAAPAPPTVAAKAATRFKVASAKVPAKTAEPKAEAVAKSDATPKTAGKKQAAAGSGVAKASKKGSPAARKATAVKGVVAASPARKMRPRRH